MKYIEDYGFEQSDLVVATAVNGYLKNLTPAARKETLEGIVRQDGAETVIDGPLLTQLIENAKAGDTGRDPYRAAKPGGHKVGFQCHV